MWFFLLALTTPANYVQDNVPESVWDEAYKIDREDLVDENNIVFERVDVVEDGEEKLLFVPLTHR